MLATCRLGAVYTVLYGGFSDEAIADRIDDFQPKIIVTANDDFALGHSTPMKELMDKAIEHAKHKPKCCFIWQRPNFQLSVMVPGRDFDLHAAIEHGKPQTYTPVEVNQPLMVVYTSGTTGKPKGVLHCSRGLAASSLLDNRFLINSNIDTNAPTPVVWLSSNFAWIVGQFGGCFKPLLWKVTSILYEGAIKDVEPEELYRMISTHNVTLFCIATPTIRTIMANDPFGNKAEVYKPFKLQTLYCGAASGDIPTLSWAEKVFGTKAIQIYGQTETGGVVVTTDCTGGNTPMLSVGKPTPGIKIQIIKDDGSEAMANEEGKIMIKMPLPPIMMVTILNNDKLFVNDMLSSHKGFYDLKDNGKLDADGNLYVLCRSDSVFKVAGDHRISCTGIEEAMMSHPDIAECVVVTKLVTKNGVTNQIPEGFFATKKGIQKSREQIARELVAIVHKQIGSLIPLSEPHQVTEFPKTVSGKISSSVIEQMLRNPSKMATIVDCDPTMKSIYESIKEIHG